LNIEKHTFPSPAPPPRSLTQSELDLVQLIDSDSDGLISFGGEHSTLPTQLCPIIPVLLLFILKAKNILFGMCPTEYLFLSTILCISEAGLEIAFKTFDRDFSNALDVNELAQLLEATRAQLPWGQTLRASEEQRDFGKPESLFGK
jgi:hypothetical protein